MVRRPLRKNSLQTGKFSIIQNRYGMSPQNLIFHRIIGGQETPKHAFPWIVRIAGGAPSFKNCQYFDYSEFQSFLSRFLDQVALLGSVLVL